MNPKIKQQKKKTNVVECLRRPFSRKKFFLVVKSTSRSYAPLCFCFKGQRFVMFTFLAFSFHFLFSFLFLMYASFSAGAKGAAIIAHLYMGNVEVAEEIRR